MSQIKNCYASLRITKQAKVETVPGPVPHQSISI
jgi:hypothetical protein